METAIILPSSEKPGKNKFWPVKNFRRDNQQKNLNRTQDNECNDYQSELAEMLK